METIKKNAMALVALAIAASYGLMSFGTSDATVKKADDLRWFNVVETISGYEYGSNPHGGSDAPPAGCENEIEDAPLCAVAFPESQINQTTGEPNEQDPEQALSQNKRYQDEPQ